MNGGDTVKDYTDFAYAVKVLRDRLTFERKTNTQQRVGLQQENERLREENADLKAAYVERNLRLRRIEEVAQRLLSDWQSRRSFNQDDWDTLRVILEKEEKWR